MLSSGIDPAKVFRIPIGIEPQLFGPHTAAPRAALGLPDDAFVVGSFQKDGVGWDDGLEPKLVKGPDVLVAALAALHERRTRACTCCSRGRRADSSRRGWSGTASRTSTASSPRYEDIGSLYAALDAYVVPSRQEGGPKGVLESMAAGVPLVSTRVGQAVDLVRDGENGWLVEVDDVDALVEPARGDRGRRRRSRRGHAPQAARPRTPTRTTSQLPLWRGVLRRLRRARDEFRGRSAARCGARGTRSRSRR